MSKAPAHRQRFIREFLADHENKQEFPNEVVRFQAAVTEWEYLKRLQREGKVVNLRIYRDRN